MIRTARSLAGMVSVAALGLSLVMAPAALAAPAPVAPATPAPLPAPAPSTPDDPTTSAEAKKAWLKATETASALNEKLLVAKETEVAALATARRAAADLAAARAEVAAANRASLAGAHAAKVAAEQQRTAEADQAQVQQQIDAFADASFRGARLGTLSTLLTADSPDDFLDTAANLDVIAKDSRQTLARAVELKAAAQVARERAAVAAGDAAVAVQKANSATNRATAAKQAADQAQAKAKQAAVQVAKQKASFDAEAKRLKALTAKLTEEERQAALRAAELERQAAARAAAAQRADRDRNAALNAPGGRTQSPASNGTSSTPSSAGQSTTNNEGASDDGLSAVPEPASSAAAIAVRAALSKVGSPYVFGAAGPGAFDCSGLTSWAWAQAGVSIPRTSGGQAGLRYIPLDQLQPGDLVTYYSPVHHVGMYIGNGQIVHASTESRPVYVTGLYRGGPNPTGHRPVG